MCVCFFKFVAILLWSCKRNTCKFWNKFFCKGVFWSASSFLHNHGSQVSNYEFDFHTHLRWTFSSTFSEIRVCCVCSLHKNFMCIQWVHGQGSNGKYFVTFKSIIVQSLICKSFMYLATWAKVVTRDFSHEKHME